MLTFLDAATILPLCLMQGVVPPLSHVNRKEPPPERFRAIFELLYSLLPPEMFQAKRIQQLMLTDETRETPCWATVSHMFTHHSYNHLIRNLISTVVHSSPVFREFGALYLYALFLSGGAFASWPKGERFLESLAVQPTSSTPSQTARRPRPFNIVIGRVNTDESRKDVDFIKKFYCGSSGAVSALIGCVFTLEAHQLYDIFIGYSGSTTSSGSIGEGERLFDGAISTWWLCFTGKHFYAEFQGLRKQAVGMKTSPGTWLAQNENVCVGHAAHLLGFGFGVAATTATLFLKKWLHSNRL